MNKKLFLILFSLLLSSDLFAIGFIADFSFGGQKTVDAGITWGKRGNWGFGISYNTHGYYYEKEEYDDYWGYPTVPYSGSVMNVGAFLQYDYPIMLLHFAGVNVGIDAGLKYTVSYSELTYADAILSPLAGVAVNFMSYWVTLGYRGDFHIVEAASGYNEKPFKNSFYFGVRYKLANRRTGSASSSSGGVFGPEGNNVHVLPNPSTGVPPVYRTE